jgi:flavin reductase (DIM6/NTAB) family NADH-FMN oxidoreductase RutF
MKFVVNILSATQANLAKRFAQRDPFRTDVDKELDRAMILTKEGLPMLVGCLGNITCTVVRSIPLNLRDVTEPDNSLGHEDSNGQPSELFIGRVMRVEQRHYGPVGEQIEEVHTRHEEPVERRPMVYYQKEFLTVQT